MNSSFAVYLIGYILIVAGVAYGLSAAGLGQQWIVIAVLILAGIGIIFAFSRSQSDEALRSQRQNSPQSGTSSSQEQRNTSRETGRDVEDTTREP